MILLARHGQTDDNIEPLRFQGMTDTPLNEAGRAESRELAERIAREEEVASLWSSTLSRAHETAAIVGERLGLDVRAEPRLAEADRGRWEGRLMRDVAEAEPDNWERWRAGGDFRFPGGESLGEQQARVAAALADISAVGPLPALVICHGGSIRVMLCATSGRGLEAFHEWEVPNCTVVQL